MIKLSAYRLQNLFAAARKYAKRLCVTEWYPIAEIPEQLPYLYAVQIRAICGSFSVDSSANIRTMFCPAKMKNAMTNAGWTVTRKDIVYSADIQNKVWKVYAVKYAAPLH